HRCYPVSGYSLYRTYRTFDMFDTFDTFDTFDAFDTFTYYSEKYEVKPVEFEESKPRGANRADALVKQKKEIMDMRDNGYSYAQIAEWLNAKGVIVSVSTVHRFIRGFKK
ncbi:helix-turn-helix domain-containing protein, partial [Pseudomonas savastanoi]|uniref:helix-turn-helix domain-containing protein n=1 Tax=Pseudomonas savastanoi TaxID=29438 RepID=UPI001967E620